MYSAKNSLKVWVSNYSYPYMAATTSTLAELPAGAIGFYTEAGLLLPDMVGTGFIAYRKPDGQVVKSKTFTSASGQTWLVRRKVYAAPTLCSQTITVTAANSTLYQVRLEMAIPGMGGNYILHGNYESAASGDDATAIAHALVESLNAALARQEKDDMFTITHIAGVITVQNALRPYVRGKKQGRPIWFRTSLIYPEAQAVLGTQTVAPSDGYGYAPYIAEKEFFAQGDSDELRFGGYPNSFDSKGLVAQVDPTLAAYDVVALTIDDVVQTANADVRAPQQFLLAFNSIGVTPQPTITHAINGATSVAGFAVPGSTVILSVNGSVTDTVTANSTSGAWTASQTVATAEVLTATAKDGSAATSSAATDTVTAS